MSNPKIMDQTKSAAARLQAYLRTEGITRMAAEAAAAGSDLLSISHRMQNADSRFLIPMERIAGMLDTYTYLLTAFLIPMEEEPGSTD